MGELVIRAKSYATWPGERDAAGRLAACLAWWARHLADHVPVSKIDSADVVCAVPANPPKQPFNLPDVLAAAVGRRLAVPFEPRLLRKVRPTAEIKFATDRKSKLSELAGAFEVSADVRDKVVVVVDDVVLSGATLETIGSALRADGAKRIISLVATRATKGLGANPPVGR